MIRIVNIMVAAACAASLLACQPEGEVEGEPEGQATGVVQQAAVSQAVKESRSNTIKSVHAADGRINNPLLWAGISNAETGMAHCYGEHSPYECAGPWSSECGGYVLAGYWDGPCSAQQGGLGLFQFDSGSHSDTINQHGNQILSVQGSTDVAIDFVLNKAWASSYTPPWSNHQQMYDWINGLRPGQGDWDRWLGFLAHNYNGHPLYSSGWYTAKDKYNTATVAMYNLFGHDYWYGGGSGGGVTCSPEGGTFCGGNGVTGDSSVLYVCKNGAPVVQEICNNGCYAAPAGQPDTCNSGSSTASECACSGGKYHTGTDIPVSLTYCGFRVCGMDGNVWECQTSNQWTQTGLTCGAGACACTGGTHVDGTPINPGDTECHMEVCGTDNMFYVCGGGGWSQVGGSYCRDESVDSCAGHCGGSAGSCWCDSSCAQYGDCCPDKVRECG